MAQVVYSERAVTNLERLADFLAENDRALAFVGGQPPLPTV